MRSDVTVVLEGGRQVRLSIEEGEAIGFADARNWLDEQFLRHQCAPLRQSGKVLLADKVLSVAAALGESGFADAATAQAFARAAAAALGKPIIDVDVPRMSLTY